MPAILAPLKSLRAKYVPLLAVYFTVGLSAIASVTNTIFFKDQVSLSAADLVSLGIWTSLPWSVKMVFGTLIDGLPLFGNNRKSYIIIGNLLMVLGALGMVDHASSRLLFSYFGEYIGLLITGLLTTNGVVMADIVADTMAIEMVEDGPQKDKELGMVQVLSRLSLSIGGLLGAAVTGPASTYLDSSTVYLITAALPLQCILATLWIRLPKTTPAPLNKPILRAGIVYGILCILYGTYLGSYAQLAAFVVGLVIISAMLAETLGELPKKSIKAFVMAMIAIFLFRTVPGIGPAGKWFYIQQLGFSENFLGTLTLVGAVCSLGVLWLLADSITNHSIFKTMAMLTGLVTVLSAPDIMIYYGVHDMIGISAKTLVLADTAAIAPIMQLSMIPLGVLVARNAPAKSRALYISLTASLMNIALIGGDLITHGLNKIFVVTRNDFSQLGNLMVSSLAISTGLSIIGLVVLWRSK